MGYTNVALKNRISEMYPDVSEYGITFRLDYSDEKDAYVLNFEKNSHRLTTFLDKKDADECMDGHKCIHLGVKIGEFMKNFKTQGNFPGGVI